MNARHDSFCGGFDKRRGTRREARLAEKQENGVHGDCSPRKNRGGRRLERSRGRKRREWGEGSERRRGIEGGAGERGSGREKGRKRSRPIRTPNRRDTRLIRRSQLVEAVQTGIHIRYGLGYGSALQFTLILFHVFLIPIQTRAHHPTTSTP